MHKEKINVVWLKRDLRSQDHEPLFKAEESGLPYLIIYLFEPSVIGCPDTSLRHLRFVYKSIATLDQTFKAFNRKVNLFYGEAQDVFKYLMDNYEINSLYSYRESGVLLTWERDKLVKVLCRKNHVHWYEFQRDGILRGIKNRKDWEEKWHRKMHEPIIKNVYSVSNLMILNHHFVLPENFKAKLKSDQTNIQPAGEVNALRYLNSFVANRGRNYQKHISKPLESRKGCSRLSPYLAWGNLSIRQVFQFVGTHPNGTKYDKAFSAMLTRLFWRCHFIQKFEMDCSYEKSCINKGFELLEHKRNDVYIKAWKLGITGYPLIDACMRALEETGWLNFRMRAMLVSFFTFNLDQDWRDGVYHLARLFLDYEPGIHYPQFQMQAGTTGVNTIRLYNPVKNSVEHDKDGIFIKKWIPELTDVPVIHIHEPWKMTSLEQSFCGVIIGEHYPAPIVDLVESSKFAREKIWNHRSDPSVKKDKNRILNTHVNHN
ncbi:MAG: deoxyribodipyrimidine photo-lyase [Maribacter sp.]